MKCNHCKKIIPEREEIYSEGIYSNKGWFHEECLNTLCEIQKERFKWPERIMNIFGLGAAFCFFFLATWFLIPVFKDRKKTCTYCEELCNNKCRWKKRTLFLAALMIIIPLLILKITFGRKQ